MTLPGRSLRANLSSDFNVSRMEMSPGRRFVVVEGKSDKKFLSHCFDFDCIGCDILDANSKECVLDVERKASRVGLKNFVCIVDLDFDFALKIKRAGERICLVSGDADTCDCIDLEAALFRTPAFKKVCVELEIVDYNIREDDLDSLRVRFQRCATVIGAAKAAFQKLDIHKKIETEDLLERFYDSNAVELVDSDVLNYAAFGLHASKVDEFVRVANQLLKRFDGTWALCRGHDLTTLISFSSYRIATQKPQWPPSRKFVESLLRASFERDFFRSTRFVMQINSALTG